MSDVFIHKDCGGEAEWVDVTDLDEEYVCQKCGAVLDGEDMETCSSEELDG